MMSTVWAPVRPVLPFTYLGSADKPGEMRDNIRNRKAVDAYFEEKARLAKEAEEKAKAEAEAKEAAREAKLTTDDLLREIRDLLKEK